MLGVVSFAHVHVDVGPKGCLRLCTDFGTNVRLTLAAIGQITSPLRKLLG